MNQTNTNTAGPASLPGMDELLVTVQYEFTIGMMTGQYVGRWKATSFDSLLPVTGRSLETVERRIREHLAVRTGWSAERAAAVVIHFSLGPSDARHEALVEYHRKADALRVAEAEYAAATAEAVRQLMWPAEGQHLASTRDVARLLGLTKAEVEALIDELSIASGTERMRVRRSEKELHRAGVWRAMRERREAARRAQEALLRGGATPPPSKNTKT